MYRQLFVPVDGSELSDRAMQVSLDLARQLGAAVVGFVVEPEVPLPAFGTVMSEYDRVADAHIERTDSHAREVLVRFEQMAADAGVGFRGLHARTDQVDRAIAEQAQEQSCDMIVMATHGRGVFGEMLFGSHTKNVMSLSTLPLLVVH